MMDLLISIMISVCPANGRVVTECHEFFVNCAVDTSGDITEKSIQKCLERYLDEKQKCCGSTSNSI